MVLLESKEKDIAEKISDLKNKSGSHSPSKFTIIEKVPDVKINVDACFLSNPYATELFLKYFNKELLETGKIVDILEFYPSQNEIISEALARYLNIDHKNIFIGNGAIEIIQAVLHTFVKRKIIINIPTFSSYYEFVTNNVEVVYNDITDNGYFKLDIDKFLELTKSEKPDAVVIINPNNPDGSYIPAKELEYIIKNLQDVENIIIDESFIHFAYEDSSYEMKSVTDLIKTYENLIVIKSMSKDFGIAGIRAGYAVMSKDRVSKLLKNGYLWNSNGLAEYFFKLYTRQDFLDEYEKVRIEYIQESQKFFTELSKINNIKVYESLANFSLVELVDGTLASDFFYKLLIKYGIYTRLCYDKIGLKGEFLRISSRKKEENKLIIDSMTDIFKE